MPPLIWRERITVCPKCASSVQPDVSVCPACGSEFETPRNTTIMRRRQATRKEIFWIATTVSTSILSLFFLIIAVFLSDFHKFIPPIHENIISYSTVLIALIVASLYFISRNRTKERKGAKIGKFSRMLPFVVILFCLASLVLVAFAREVDQMMTDKQFYVPVLMIAAFVLLSARYLWSIGDSSYEKDKTESR